MVCGSCNEAWAGRGGETRPCPFALNTEFESRWSQESSRLHVVQTGSGAHPRSHAMSTGGNRPRREADHLPQTSVVFKNT
jgi:hypothetical protein